MQSRIHRTAFLSTSQPPFVALSWRGNGAWGAARRNHHQPSIVGAGLALPKGTPRGAPTYGAKCIPGKRAPTALGCRALPPRYSAASPSNPGCFLQHPHVDPGRIPADRARPATQNPLFRLDSPLFALKIEFVLSSFFAVKNAKPCVSNKSLSSFPLFSIFFAFSCHFLSSAGRCRIPFPRSLPALSIGQLQ